MLFPCKFVDIICRIELEDETMKAFLFACAGAIIIAAVSAGVLSTMQKSVQQAFVTTGVRL
jgi:hypothetical protein